MIGDDESDSDSWSNQHKACISPSEELLPDYHEGRKLSSLFYRGIIGRAPFFVTLLTSKKYF